MDINDIMDICVDALIADSSILNWCNTNYSSPHTIYEGLDTRNDPSETDYPVIHICPLSKDIGYGTDQAGHLIYVACGINDSTLSTSTDTNGVVHKKYRGIEYIEDFRYLIESAIVTEIESNTNTPELIIDSVHVAYDTMEAFPYFVCPMVMELNKKYSQGDDAFA